MRVEISKLLLPIIVIASVFALGFSSSNKTRIAVADDIDDGPRLHLDFEGDDGAFLFDASVNEAHGEIVGEPEHAAGHSGSGLRLAGRHQYLSVDDPKVAIGGWRELTLASWVRLDRHSTYGSLATVAGLGGESQDGLAFQLGGHGAGAHFRISVGDKGHCYARASDGRSSPLELDRWHHVAATWDGNVAELWIDGTSVARQECSDLGEIRSGPGNMLVIGRHAGHRWGWSDAYLAGTIDDFLLFDRALEPSEIAGLAR